MTEALIEQEQAERRRKYLERNPAAKAEYERILTLEEKAAADRIYCCVSCGMRPYPRNFVGIGTYKVGHFDASQTISLCGECVDLCAEIIAKARQDNQLPQEG